MIILIGGQIVSAVLLHFYLFIVLICRQKCVQRPPAAGVVGREPGRSRQLEGFTAACRHLPWENNRHEWWFGIWCL